MIHRIVVQLLKWPKNCGICLQKFVFTMVKMYNILPVLSDQVSDFSPELELMFVCCVAFVSFIRSAQCLALFRLMNSLFEQQAMIFNLKRVAVF